MYNIYQTQAGVLTAWRPRRGKVGGEGRQPEIKQTQRGMDKWVVASLEAVFARRGGPTTIGTRVPHSSEARLNGRKGCGSYRKRWHPQHGQRMKGRAGPSSAHKFLVRDRLR